jgi:ribosomal protein L11 methyltransferase
VVALFADEPAAADAGKLLVLQPFFKEAELLGIQPLEAQDWVRLTQSQFEPVPITDTFWVVPSWHEPPAQAQWILRLDPGLAFGTGTHPTTRMCLRWIAMHPPQGQRVLDYGCGSGILAIGAAMLGAAEVHAVDIDPDALVATEANARANQVQIQTGSSALASGSYPLVVANILAAPLKVLAPLLCAHVALGGHLLLAGILKRQTEEIQSAYQPFLALQVADEQDGWVLMHALRV